MTTAKAQSPNRPAMAGDTIAAGALDAAVVITVADDAPDEIHALRHRTHPVWGVQFHPESILTEHGKTLLANFLSMAR